MSSTQMEIANTIAAQVGQRALFMMGAKNLCATGDGLSFKISGCKAYNYVTIKLLPTDEYKVIFAKSFKLSFSAWKEVEGVQVSQLHEVLSENTGLALSL